MARSTGWPMRATFRMDILTNYTDSVPGFALHPHDDSHAYRFCPRCGGALERRLLKATEPERLVCAQCGFVFYIDPEDCRRHHHPRRRPVLVLVRRAIDPGYGKWVVPGGYVDRGEPLTVAAIREAREECGLDVRLDGLVNIYSYPGRAPVIVVYAATALGGTLAVDDEGLEAVEFEPRTPFPGTSWRFAAPPRACATIWPACCIRSRSRSAPLEASGSATCITR